MVVLSIVCCAALSIWFVKALSLALSSRDYPAASILSVLALMAMMGTYFLWERTLL